MSRRFATELLGWGFGLWLIGYVLGIVLIAVVESSLIGWLILPIGVAATSWVLLKKIRSQGLPSYVMLGVTWTFLAIVGDYFFIVRAFHPADGYYKPDVYLYYALTLFLPVVIGWWKTRTAANRTAPIG